MNRTSICFDKQINRSVVFSRWSKRFSFFYFYCSNKQSPIKTISTVGVSPDRKREIGRTSEVWILYACRGSNLFDSWFKIRWLSMTFISLQSNRKISFSLRENFPTHRTYSWISERFFAPCGTWSSKERKENCSSNRFACLVASSKIYAALGFDKSSMFSLCETKDAESKSNIFRIGFSRRNFSFHHFLEIHQAV